MSAVLQFDPAEHRYSVDGREIPSVTTILKDAGMVDYSFCTEFARERGSMAHKAIHFDMENDLDETSLNPMLVGYVQAARAVVRDLRLTTLAVERRLHSPLMDVAGTLDYLGEADGKIHLIDWKTGDPPPAVALQLAAYADLLHEDDGTRVARRIAARLRQDGTYTLVHYTDRHDIAKFRAAVQVAAWRKEHGLL